MRTSAQRSGDTSTFTVWAPLKDKMVLHIVHPYDQQMGMIKNDEGYFNAIVKGLPADTQYFFMPGGEKDYPDPASQFQPLGVHGPSQIVDHSQYRWHDENWKAAPLKDLIIYELHIGTFTTEGTFESVIGRLDELVDTGINAIELMPVAQFPGNRNWGYDGVYPYAVQNSYGGPEGLKKLVDACHQKNIAVFLDVVYNHLGPEGNYLSQFGPYFTKSYCTPWGDAINFDGEWSDGVREYFSQNILYWFEHYHLDGLRVDAIHTIYDSGAVHFWELCYNNIRYAEAKWGRKLYLIAESDFNSPRVVQLPEVGGYGFNAQWLDDFHHALYVLLHPQGKIYYEDFGKIEQLAKAYIDGFVHSGEYVTFRKRKHGRSSAGIPGEKFIAFNQNHDQVGNRVKGERLCMLIDFERQKIAAAAILLSPYIPLLFMGEEYSDESPFCYFVDHSDADLIKAVREGRKKEFENYKWNGEPPDPQSEQTFLNSKLRWEKRNTGKHKIMLQWFKTLIELRHSYPILKNYNKNDITASVLGNSGLVIHRQDDGGKQHMLCLFNFSEQELSYIFSQWSEQWEKILDSREQKWNEHQATRESTLPSTMHAGEDILVPSLSVVVFISK